MTQLDIITWAVSVAFGIIVPVVGGLLLEAAVGLDRPLRGLLFAGVQPRRADGIVEPQAEEIK